MTFIDKLSGVDAETLLGGVAGFYGTIFRDNPGKLDKWIRDIEKLSERGQNLFLYALWISNNQNAREYLEQKEKAASGDYKIGLQELLESKPPDLRAVIPNNPVDGDMLWGAFLATGEPIYIVNMIEATTQYVGRDDYEAFVYTAMGKWSLASNAQVHEIVYQTLKQQLSEYEGEKKAIIQEILDMADLPSGPNIIVEKAKRFIEEQQKKGKWLEFDGQQ